MCEYENINPTGIIFSLQVNIEVAHLLEALIG